MRAIWFILKLPLKILMAPVILSLTLFVWICVSMSPVWCWGLSAWWLPCWVWQF